MNWLDTFSNMPPSRVRQLVWAAVGSMMIITGILIALQPLLMGSVLVCLGTFVLLRTSAEARRWFVRLKRRFPNFFYPLDAWRRRRRASVIEGRLRNRRFY